MRILVCVKQVPATAHVTVDEKTGVLQREGVESKLNPYDLFALETALRLREEAGGTVTAITMGPPAAEAVLRECLALGADRAVLVTGREFGGADTLSTSYVIAKAALQLGNYDLIFCGKETLDGATGQMGSQLAERFGSSQVTSMSLIKSVDIENGKIVVEREVENGVETIEAQMPCLFTVEKTNYPPRLPNYRGKKAARKAEIITLGPGDIEGLDPKLIGVPGSGTIVPRIYPPVLPEAGQIIDEGSAAASAAKLCAILAAEGRI